MIDNVSGTLARICEHLTAPGSAFAMTEVSVGGRKMRVFASADTNVNDILLRAEERYAARDLSIDGHDRATYAQIFGAARQLAACLRHRHGVVPGAHVGIAMHNCALWLIAYAAIMQLGAVSVLFNSRGTTEELATACANVPCRIILADDVRAERLLAAGLETPILNILANSATAPAGKLEQPAVQGDPDAPATILFTSGTAGPAKGAVLTQRNIVNMARNVAFITASSIALEAELRGIDPAALGAAAPIPCGLLAFPLFHVSGLTAFFRTIENGGSMVFQRRWNPADALGDIETLGVMMLSGPPLMLSDLLDLPRAAERMRSVNALVVGGQATPQSLIDRARRALPKASFSIGWGMTEVSGAVAAASGSLCVARPQTCGMRSPLIDLRVVNSAGHDVPCGEVGEIWVRGALVMRGYFNAPSASEAAIQDGWLRSGDVGSVDAYGVVQLVDRKKDVVVSGGENIHCGEVERVIGAHPDVTEAFLFGIPDDRLGERAIAAVTLRPGARLTETALQAAIRTRLANYKVPTAIVFDLHPFPRTATGKVNKAALRARYLETIARPAAALA